MTSQTIRVHRLKTLPEYIDEFQRGVRSFDLRPHDRDFRVGDHVKLEAFEPRVGQPSTRAGGLILRIAHVLSREDALGAQALKPGWCALALGWAGVHKDVWEIERELKVEIVAAPRKGRAK